MKADYKLKYQELKLRFMNSVDTAYRLGFEAGAQQAQVQQAQEQQAQAQEMQQAAMQGQPGEEQGGQPQDEQGQEEPAESHPQGSELDQHIAQLESMLGKSEPNSEAYMSLKKSLDGIKSFRQAQLDKINMKKAEKAIKAIGNALNKKPALAMSKQAEANLNTVAKRALAKQEEILKDVFQQWEQEENSASKGIADILNVEGISTKE